MKPVNEKNINEACKYHNVYRQMHSCKEVKLDKKLCDDAQKHADLQASQNRAFHDNNTQDGENIFVIKEGKIVVDCWYNELKNYNYKNPVYTPKSGHFTQLVWRESQKLGYGEAVSKNGTTYVVCRYSPAGNVDGFFDENVLPPLQRRIAAPMVIKEGLNFDEFLVLLAHNDFRKLHGCESLKWSQTLKEASEKRAKEFIDAGGSKDLPPSAEYGENYAILNGYDIDGNIVVNLWYQEGENYDFKNPKASPNQNHFTQIIWRSTTEIGYCKKEVDDERWIFIAMYSPKGNIENEYINNVSPLFIKPSEDKSQEDELNALKKAVLDKHNEYRSKHGCVSLEWSMILYKEAFKWAEYLITSAKIEKNPNSKRGQNIGFEWQKNIRPDKIIKKWYGQEELYNYQKSKGKMRTEAFTQVVWASTKYVGFASVSDQGITVYVSLYWPPGNISGLYADNVFPKNEPEIAPSLEFTDYKNLMVKHHNMYRVLHRSKKVKLSEKLSIAAEKAASRILTIFSREKNFGFYSRLDFISNYLFSNEPEFPHPRIVSQVWYSTGIHFEYDADDIDPESRPFCEIVWKTTKSIGVGAAKNDKMSVVVVIYDRCVKEKEKAGSYVKRQLEQYETLKNGS